MTEWFWKPGEALKRTTLKDLKLNISVVPEAKTWKEMFSRKNIFTQQQAPSLKEQRHILRLKKSHRTQGSREPHVHVTTTTPDTAISQAYLKRRPHY